jgi:hypothetical protein
LAGCTTVRRWHHRRYGVDSSFMFKVVELEVNSMCNRKCSYCPNVSARRPSAFMDDALFDKIIGELGEMGFDGRVSYHFYGEPLLDKRLPDLVRKTRERVPLARTEIYSNGDFLDLETFRMYLGKGLDHFLITQHDNLIPPNLQQLLDNLTEAEKKHLTIRFAKDRYMINRSGLIQGLGVVSTPLPVACDWPLTTMVITGAGQRRALLQRLLRGRGGRQRPNADAPGGLTSETFASFHDALARGDRTKSHLCHECDYVPNKAVLERIIPPDRKKPTVALPWPRRGRTPGACSTGPEPGTPWERYDD